MECPCGGLGWDALAADLDEMPLQRTWMGCPCGGLGWDQHGADLDGMPLWWHGVDLDEMPLRQTWMRCPIMKKGVGFLWLYISFCV